MPSLIRTVAMVVLFMAAALPVHAEEAIRAYDVRIDLARDGTMMVRETIRASVEGREIRRGIFRDLPLTFIDETGRMRRVDFKLSSVMRDGRQEPFRTESIAGGIRIYTGDADVLLPHGEHVFEIAYETGRQVRFFPDHDELYWNATGTEWAFSIRTAKVEVFLPSGVRVQSLDVFTGPYGATQKNARALEASTLDDAGRIVFSTTGILGPRQGMTIVVAMPKGSIEPPSAAQRRTWWFRDNLAWMVAAGSLLVVFVYYLFSWRKVGRDPPRGVVVPRWDAPDGISPALVNYIDNRGFSGQGWTALSASALNLAVGGYLELQDLKTSIVLKATGKGSPKQLPAGEASLMKAVAAQMGTFTIDKDNGPAVQKAGADFRSAMEREHRNAYYHANTPYVWGGVILSALLLIVILFMSGGDEDTSAIVLVPVAASVFIAIFSVVISSARRSAKTLATRIRSVIVTALSGFVIISIGFLVLAGTMSAAVASHQIPLLVCTGGIVMLNVLFVFIMGAPTPMGAKMMDGIDGLRQYLMLAEEERMNMAGAPEMSPQHFEKLLPYAVALGLEKPWSQTFDRWLLTATTAAASVSAAYHPGWYQSDVFSAGSLGDRMGEFSGSMASTMTAALPPPPRSSSSGSSGSSSGGSSSGGFSGGGGGGGGGGGW